MCAREAKWTDKLSEKMSERQTAGLEPEVWRFSAFSFRHSLAVHRFRGIFQREGPRG